MPLNKSQIKEIAHKMFIDGLNNVYERDFDTMFEITYAEERGELQ